MAEINVEEVWQSAKIKYSFPKGLQLKTVLTEDLNVFWRRKIASLICQQVSRKPMLFAPSLILSQLTYSADSCSILPLL